MLSREELNDANMKIPQAIQYLVETSTKLLETIAELEDERDEYRRKYLDAESRRLGLYDIKIDDDTIPSSD